MIVSNRNKRNKRNQLLVVTIVLAAVLLCMLVFLLIQGPGQKSSQDGLTQTASAQTKTELTDPASNPLTTAPGVTWMTTPEINATYEQWLCGAMVMGISMQYPDFELLGIYAASETDISQMGSSQGAYVRFVSNGEEILIHSLPLEGERKAKGTTDLYTAYIGYATFDIVEIGNVDLDSMQVFELEELAEVIDFSLLVSLYSR